MIHGFTLSNCLLVALDSLGQSSDAIAGSLRAKGCAGERVSASRCPLANYVRRLLPDYHINVDDVVKITAPPETAPILGYGIVAEFPLPEPHFAFITAFDNGAYPDLEQEKPETDDDHLTDVDAPGGATPTISDQDYEALARLMSCGPRL